MHTESIPLFRQGSKRANTILLARAHVACPTISFPNFISGTVDSFGATDWSRMDEPANAWPWSTPGRNIAPQGIRGWRDCTDWFLQPCQWARQSMFRISELFQLAVDVRCPPSSWTIRRCKHWNASECFKLRRGGCTIIRFQIFVLIKIRN